MAYCTTPDDDVEQSMECLAGETEVLGESPPQCRVVYHKFHVTEPGLPPWKAGD
jgi:hypothetical protein